MKEILEALLEFLPFSNETNIVIVFILGIILLVITFLGLICRDKILEFFK
jgi:hypothetical protein